MLYETIGKCVFWILVIGLVGNTIYVTYIGIQNLILGYKCKHRFDKPPVAQCYCKDCNHRFKNGFCTKRAEKVKEDSFCDQAETILYKKRQYLHKMGKHIEKKQSI